MSIKADLFIFNEIGNTSYYGTYKFPMTKNEWINIKNECDLYGGNEGLFSNIETGNKDIDDIIEDNWEYLNYDQITALNETLEDKGYDAFYFAYLKCGNDSSLSHILEYAYTNNTELMFTYDEVGGEDWSDLAYYMVKNGNISIDNLSNFIDYKKLGESLSYDYEAGIDGFYL